MTQAVCSFTSAHEGYRQEVEFTSTGVFSVMVLPTGAPVGGALVCPSLFSDLHRNLRREVLLARRLARLGVAVRRFHYRGTGSSVDHTFEMAWESLVDDARDAQLRLSNRIGNDLPLGVMGARFGSLIALALGAGRPDVPLVLWEPIAGSTTYARDLERVDRIARITESSGLAPATPNRRLPARLSDVAAELSIAKIGADGVGDVLVVRAGRAAARSDNAATIDALRAVATSVAVSDHADEVGWWAFTKLPRGTANVLAPMIDETATWLRNSINGHS